MGLGLGRNDRLMCIECYNVTKKRIEMNMIDKKFDNSDCVLVIEKTYKCKICGHEEKEKEVY